MLKGVLAAIMVLFFPVLAMAAPFLVCDPYPTTATQPTEFVMTFQNGTIVTAPAVAVTGGVALKYDLAPLAAGSYTVTIKAVKVDAEFGRLESTASSPFTFVKPVAPAAPANISIAK